jgi:hypothetical protein
MIWTNIFKLPKPLEILITKDLYNIRRDSELAKYCQANGLDKDKIKHFSLSDLIRPPRMRVLTKRHSEEIVKDIAADVYRLLGQAIHFILREAAIHGELEKEGYKAEIRMFSHFQMDGETIVISGEPDIVGPDMRIQDYKVVAVGQWLKGIKDEWEKQVNGYAWLRSENGLVTTGLDISFILRDFKKDETIQEGYPQAGAQMVEARLWTYDEQKAWIYERAQLHLQSEYRMDDDLPHCTGYDSPNNEMWEQPEAWAVIREGGQRAAKLHRSEELGKDVALASANADAKLRNEKLKKGEKPYLVTHRPGERRRCQSYCDVRGFCDQWKEYTHAAFLGSNSNRYPAPAPGQEGR